MTTTSTPRPTRGAVRSRYTPISAAALLALPWVLCHDCQVPVIGTDEAKARHDRNCHQRIDALGHATGGV